jgi:hypothetical protein
MHTQSMDVSKLGLAALCHGRKQHGDKFYFAINKIADFNRKFPLGHSMHAKELFNVRRVLLKDMQSA